MYEIMYDDGKQGSFSSVMQLSDSLTVTSNIEQGLQYRLKYRAKNFNGWGVYSDISYIIAASVPSKPLAPVYVESSSSSVTFALVSEENTSGSPITTYKLYVDTLGIQDNYRLVYSGDSQ